MISSAPRTRLALVAAAVLLGACDADRLVAPTEAPAVPAPSLALAATASADLPTLPLATVDVTPVAPTGRTINVPAGGNLQAAINAAVPGDVLLLAAGATFTGNFTLPNKSGAGWVTIRTATPDSKLPVGKRVSPAQASLLPNIVSPNGGPALRAYPGAHHYRLIGLEIAAKTTVTSSSQLLAIGSGSRKTQGTLSRVPHHIVVDRSYIHGRSTMNLKNCIELHAAHAAVVNSHVSQCHSSWQESHGIIGYNGPGPFLIENNHIAGAGINVMFGGADPASVDLMPRDITLRRNHVTKPKTWRQVWLAKNLLELKLGRRVLVEQNVFENSWPDGQTGFAFVIKSVNQSGTAPWSETSDVTVRHNVIRNAAHGVSISAKPGSREAVPVARVRFAHNLFERIGTGDWSGGRLFQITGVDDLQIEHNTAVSKHSAMILTSGDLLDRLVVRNNVFASIAYGVTGDGAGSGIAALTARAAPGWTFAGNVFSKDFSSSHPARNFYASSVSSVGFVDFAAYNLALKSGSSYENDATDGTDPGADVAAVRALTAAVAP